MLSKSSLLLDDNSSHFGSPPLKTQQKEREMARDKELWMQAVNVAADAMWLMKPADYFSKVFQGIQSSEMADANSESKCTICLP